jgi:nucleoid-associated protein Lsr2
MATITNVVLTDDLDGTEATGTVRFGLDGQLYEIDLNDPNAQAMRDAFARYVEVARKIAASQPAKRGRKPGTTSRGGGGSTVPPASFRPPTVNGNQPLTADERAQLREWAATRPDVKVAERGRIAASVVAEWRASR